MGQLAATATVTPSEQSIGALNEMAPLAKLVPSANCADTASECVTLGASPDSVRDVRRLAATDAPAGPSATRAFNVSFSARSAASSARILTARSTNSAYVGWFINKFSHRSTIIRKRHAERINSTIPSRIARALQQTRDLTSYPLCCCAPTGKSELATANPSVVSQVTGLRLFHVRQHRGVYKAVGSAVAVVVVCGLRVPNFVRLQMTPNPPFVAGDVRESVTSLGRPHRVHRVRADKCAQLTREHRRYSPPPAVAPPN